MESLLNVEATEGDADERRYEDDARIADACAGCRDDARVGDACAGYRDNARASPMSVQVTKTMPASPMPVQVAEHNGCRFVDRKVATPLPTHLLTPLPTHPAMHGQRVAQPVCDGARQCAAFIAVFI